MNLSSFSPSPLARPTTRAWAAALAIFWVALLPAEAAEPFYEARLDDGTRAYESGRHSEAARELGLACFGLLDEPSRLAGCLSLLALAHAALDDRTAFEEVFRRIAEVERRFEGYSKAELSPVHRAAFEDRASRWIGTAELAAVPAFSDIARRKLESQLASMPTDRRRERLGELVAASPDEPRWRLALARLELDERQPGAALAAVAPLVAVQPENAEARCLEGRARAGLSACEAALPALAFCQPAGAVAEQRVGCLADLSRWAEADQLMTALPAGAKSSRSMNRLAKRVRKGLEQAQRDAARRAREEATARAAAADESALPVEPPPEPITVAAPEAVMPLSEERQPSTAANDETPSPEPTAEAPTATPPQTQSEDRPVAEPTSDADQRPAQALPARAARQLRRASELAARARFDADLEEPARIAFGVADSFPNHAEAQFLAAEIAYRASRWEDAARFFRRAGDPGDSDPLRLFYMAVAFHEVGETEAARQHLERCLPQLERTAFVEAYVVRILPAGSGS